MVALRFEPQVVLAAATLAAAILASRAASAQMSAAQDGYLRVGVGPSYLASRLSLATYDPWAQYGGGASTEIALGTSLSARSVLGGALSLTAFPSLVLSRDDKTIDSELSALVLLGPFIDVGLSASGQIPLRLEFGVAAAFLSMGGRPYPFSTRSTVLPGAVANLGFRLPLFTSARVSWDLGGRLSAGAVTRGDVTYSDGFGPGTVLLFMPSVLVSLVYR